MKSLAELETIRANTLEQISMRKDRMSGIHVVVNMGTCGIAAGARDVVVKFMEEIGKRGLQNISLTQCGCAGSCSLEPMLNVIVPGQEKVTYVHVTPDMVARIVDDHIVGGHPVKEFTIGAAEKQ